MFAPTTEICDPNGNAIALSHLVSGASVLSRSKGKLCAGAVRKVASAIDLLSVTLVVSSGRRLSVAGKQMVFVKGKDGKPRWKSARTLEVGAVLYTVTDGILTVDRLVCTVHSAKPGEPWMTISSTKGNVFAEEILCRAS